MLEKSCRFSALLYFSPSSNRRRAARIRPSLVFQPKSSCCVLMSRRSPLVVIHSRKEYFRWAFVSNRKVLSASWTSLLVLIPIKGSTGLPGVKSLLAFSSFVVDCFTDDFPRIQSLGPAAGSLYPVVGFGSYSAPARPPRRSGRNRCRES